MIQLMQLEFILSMDFTQLRSNQGRATEVYPGTFFARQNVREHRVHAGWVMGPFLG